MWLQRPNVIVVGLGGTGSGIANALAGALKRYNLRERGKSELPPHIEVLAIDTDSSSLSKMEHLRKGSAIDPRVEDASALMNAGPGISYSMVQDCISAQGLGMQRYCAALLFNAKEGHFMNLFRRVAEELAHRNQGIRHFLVILVSSFGGGTGSGLMPWVAACARAALYPNPTTIIGVGTLPGRGELDLYYANAYALLKELSLLQMLKEPIELGVESGVQRIGNPFDSFIVLGISTHRREDLKKDVQDAIIHFLMDLGYLVPEYRPAVGKEIGKLADLADVHTLVSESPNRFVTINYYEVALPVPILEWMFEFEEKRPELERRLQDILSQVDSVKDELEDVRVDIKKKLEVVGKLKERVEGILEEESLPDIAERNYRRALARLDEIKSFLEGKLGEIKDSLIPRLEDIRQMAHMTDRKLKDLRYEYDHLMDQVKSPPKSLVRWVIPLDDQDIAKLRSLYKKGTLSRLTLRQIMGELGKEDQFFNLVVRQGFTGAATEPYLLEYVVGGESPYMKDQDVRDILVKKEFLEKKGGQIVDPLNRPSDTVMAMISSHPDNIPERAIAGQAWEDLVRSRVREGQYKEIHNELRRHSFGVYYMAIGLRTVPPVAGIEPPLRDLVNLHSKYEKLASEQEMRVLARHSLFLGKALAVVGQLGIPVSSSTDPEEATRALVQFYRSYTPMDPSDTMLIMAHLVASAKVGAERVQGEVAEFAERVKMIDFSPGASDPTVLLREFEDLDTSVKRISVSIEGLGETLKQAEEMISAVGRCEPVVRTMVEKYPNKAKNLKLLMDEARFSLESFAAQTGYGARESEEEGEGTIAKGLMEAADHLSSVASKAGNIPPGSPTEWKIAVLDIKRIAPKLTGKIRSIVTDLERLSPQVRGLSKVMDQLATRMREYAVEVGGSE